MVNQKFQEGSNDRAYCQFLKQKLGDGPKKYLSTYSVKRIRNSELYLTAMNQISPYNIIGHMLIIGKRCKSGKSTFALSCI